MKNKINFKKPSVIIFGSICLITMIVSISVPSTLFYSRHTIKFDYYWKPKSQNHVQVYPDDEGDAQAKFNSLTEKQLETDILYNIQGWIWSLYNNILTVNLIPNMFCYWDYSAEMYNFSYKNNIINFEVMVHFLDYQKFSQQTHVTSSAYITDLYIKAENVTYSIHEYDAKSNLKSYDYYGILDKGKISFMYYVDDLELNSKNWTYALPELIEKEPTNLFLFNLQNNKKTNF